ncbi:hypothetical protein LX81_02912 [Palleronia aestuarii]|uniref:Uncharacterized protein n=1 Tax=Palleronia aestuarii TaxID=568105 RepID=A0A2W7PXQ3_9RHOB|nr:hypothetical protein [Palleronia aestuarii]PZX14329.1 hypothetical protein LX81_02912 [Palleronia aestuarii]
MALPKLRPAPQADPQPPLIGFLRLAALDCRAAPRRAGIPDLPLDPAADAADYATVLARMLPELFLRRPVLWRPGTARRSFDEAWLLAFARAIETDDRTSERFLAGRRLRPGAAPVLRHVLGGLADRLRTPRPA